MSSVRRYGGIGFPFLLQSAATLALQCPHVWGRREGGGGEGSPGPSDDDQEDPDPARTVWVHASCRHRAPIIRHWSPTLPPPSPHTLACTEALAQHPAINGHRGGPQPHPVLLALLLRAPPPWSSPSPCLFCFAFFCSMSKPTVASDDPLYQPISPLDERVLGGGDIGEDIEDACHRMATRSLVRRGEYGRDRRQLVPTRGGLS